MAGTSCCTVSHPCYVFSDSNLFTIFNRVEKTSAQREERHSQNQNLIKD